MLTYASILAMGLAGYAGAPWWLVLPGAACLTFDSWGSKLLPLDRHPRVSWSSKTTTYFVTGVCLDIVLAALGFGAGRLARVFVGCCTSGVLAGAARRCTIALGWIWLSLSPPYS